MVGRGHHDGVVAADVAEQRLLLVALAEAQLRDPSAVLDLPTNRQIAASLGWTITKYNRKLDGLCVKFAAHGVSGLRGSTRSRATAPAPRRPRSRRVRLADHAARTPARRSPPADSPHRARRRTAAPPTP